MAIIKAVGALEAVVMANARPILNLDGGSSWGDGENLWSQRFLAAREHLLRASRAVGCVVPDGKDQPYVGTAFAVAPHLAVTASHVADALQGRESAPSTRGWIDFADRTGAQASRIEIAGVHRVHPNWRFAFLSLKKEVAADSVLGIADPGVRDRLQDRVVVVVGYPMMGGSGSKQMMPGKLQGMGEYDEYARVIRHDASTLAGCSGGPLIDMETGLVIGMHFAGRPQDSNYAAPAWEFKREPQWAPLWNGPAAGAHGAKPVAPAAVRTSVFTGRRLVELQKLLVDHNLSQKTDVLFATLPRPLVSELEELSTPQDRLFAALAALNRKLYVLEDALPIEAVLDAAEVLSFDLRNTGGLKPYRQEAEQVRIALVVVAGG